ncbi:MAG: hypothetical protein IJY72_00200 [Akkermansia sp.]|nr:hypothetical protein [Akkermansia sp.]
MAPVFGFAYAEAGAVGSLPYKHQFAALRACEPNVQFQNPKFKIQLFNGLRPSEKRALPAVKNRLRTVVKNALRAW